MKIFVFIFFNEAIQAFEQMKSGVSTSDVMGADLADEKYSRLTCH